MAAAAAAEAPGFRWRLLAALTAVKLLLAPAYRSTDFEVHRNWLAITASLPPSRWYIEATSPWTLDYPPLFAWFEWALSHAARLADPRMLALENLDYASEATIWFQRGSVIATDAALAAAAFYATAGRPPAARDAAFAAAVASAGLLLVDHIHFQYNGMLLGLLVASIALVERRRGLAGAVAFAALLNMKHLFVAAAPAYFVYLLRQSCRGRRAVVKFLQLGGAVAAIFAASFGPFIWMGQLRVVLSRLFPFGRGLTHAYWAPNLWALYAAADRAAAALAPRLELAVAPPPAAMTGGLVGTARFAVLPQVPPAATAALVLAAQAPALVLLWRRPRPAAFADAVVYCLLCAFAFGFHVHEKAILTVLVPMALGAARSPASAAEFLFLAAAGHQGLLPLLHQPREWPIKVAITSLYFLGVCALLTAATGGTTEGADDRTEEPRRQRRRLPLAAWQRAYLWGLVPLELYCAIGHRLLCGAAFGGPRLPFLPLLLTSVYCAIGVMWTWAAMAARFVRQRDVAEAAGADGHRLKAA